MSSSIDNLVTNELERARSGDQNLQTTLAGRAIAEALRALFGSPSYVGIQPSASTGVTTLMATMDRVWGFALGNTSSSTNLVVGAGALLQDYVGLGETPTADDSSYRLGLALEDANVALPTADGNWHMLECRVSPTYEQEERDILTAPVTRTYTPQMVIKRDLKRITFKVITGSSNALPTVETGWTPLYGFKLPTTPAAFFLAGIVDLRPSSSPDLHPESSLGGGLGTRDPFGGQTRVLSRELMTDGLAINSSLVTFKLAAELDGQLLEAATATVVDGSKLMLTDFTTASGWHYVYLAPAPQALGYRNCGNAIFAAQGVQVMANCQVIISTVAPRPDGRNSATISCLQPWTGQSVPVGGAVCASVLYKLSGITAWEGMRIAPSGRAYVVSKTLDQLINTTTITETSVDFTGVQVLPINMVRMAEVQVGMLPRTTSQTGTGVNAKLIARTTLGLHEVANNVTFGSVMFDPLVAEDFRQFSAMADGPSVPVSATGKVAVQIETRTSAGETTSALLSEATTGTARVLLRVVGFQM